MKDLNAICVLILGNVADGLNAAAEDICKLGRPLRTSQSLESSWMDLLAKLRDENCELPLENANYLEAMGFIEVATEGGWKLTDAGLHQCSDMPFPGCSTEGGSKTETEYHGGREGAVAYRHCGAILNDTLYCIDSDDGIADLIRRLREDEELMLRRGRMIAEEVRDDLDPTVETLRGHLSSSRANVRRLQAECKRLEESLLEVKELYESTGG